MLPEILLASYKRYKEDTNVFTTWLSKAAFACGFKSTDVKPQGQSRKEPPKDAVSKLSGGRLKGKARKEAKATASNDKSSQNQASLPTPTVKYTMTTKDLLRQAELVAKSSKTQLPANVLRMVERTIHARQRCTSWFQTVKAKESASTDQHVHFTNILEKALDILRRSLASIDGSKEPSTAGLQAEQSKSSNISNEDLNNRFGALEIEILMIT